ncbi:MAG: hypothetical protein GY715_21815 [Planctomycetes bacterium]|nr:hypothetical protein [Planctomycetota bacterium]
MALTIQLVVWGLTTFTQLRWTEIRVQDQPPIIVQRETRLRRLHMLDDGVTDSPHQEAVDPNRVPSRFNSIFATATALAGGIGIIGCLVLIPLLGLGVVLAASSATNGVERAVSAMGWALAAVLLSLPLGKLIGLPWDDGALWSYASLCAAVDGVDGAAGVLDGSTSDKAAFFAQYLLLPVVCIASLLLAGTMFSSGVEAGMMRREALALDETLELEAANVQPSSLHGGRTAGALQRSTAGADTSSPSVKQLTPGGQPKRLI